MTEDKAARERQFVENFESLVSASRRAEIAERSDGRTANRVRNRQAVIDTLIELVREGRSGTLDEVIERSGIARRSIFRHFTDLSDMWAAAYGRLIADVAPIAVIDRLGVGTFRERIDAYVEVRLQVFGLLHSFFLVARTRLMDQPVVADGLVAMAELHRAQIKKHFAAELTHKPEGCAEGLVDAIHILLSGDGYDVLIRQQRRSIEEVRAIWADALYRLLRD